MVSSHSNSSKLPRVVPCPRCKTPVEWVQASRFRPFCSARCKTDDLGAWESEIYRVAASEEALLSDESE